ncbi:hypothetical protein FOZ61_007584, partial [Perkinsus olseni]
VIINMAKTYLSLIAIAWFALLSGPSQCDAQLRRLDFCGGSVCNGVIINMAKTNLSLITIAWFALLSGPSQCDAQLRRLDFCGGSGEDGLLLRCSTLTAGLPSAAVV